MTGLGLGLFLAACYFPLFLHLDSLSLRLWDEARRGVNALEMFQQGHWLVPHFAGAPDEWGTKPPLLIWLQALGLRLLDSPELAVRLPSALAGLATAFLLVWAGRMLLHRPFAGYLAALVLLTSGIYIESHGAVAGDYDALLSLWLCAHVLTFFHYLQNRQNRWLYWSAGFLILAGWTKGIAAFFFTPALLVFILTDARHRNLLAEPRFYVAAAMAFLGVLSYYLIREGLHPGYLATVWENELGGRFFEAKEGHGRPFGYYFRVVHQYQLFFPWQYFLPLGFYLLLQNQDTRQLGKFLLIVTGLFLLVISLAATKLNWYVLPLIPLLSLVAGSALEQLWQGLQQLIGPQRSAWRLAGTCLFLVAIYAFPYIRIVRKAYGFEHSGPEREKMLYRDFFRRLSPDHSITVLLPGYNGHFNFYQQVFHRQGYDIKGVYLKKPHPQVQAAADTVSYFPSGALVGLCETSAANYMADHYQSDTLQSWESCKLLRITARKNQAQ